MPSVNYTALINSKFLRCLRQFLLLFLLLGGFAEAASRTKGGVPAVVVAERAIVYSEPSFDAPQVSAVVRGKKLFTSSRSFGGDMKFFKIRIGDKIGYISTIDVKRGDEEKDAGGQTRRSRSKKAKKPDGPKEAFLFLRYFGLSVGQSGFEEDIQGVNASTRLMTYGFKLTGPGILFEGPIMDLSVGLHLGAPSYYAPLSLTSPTGLLIWLDADIIGPLLTSQQSTLYWGIGPSLVYSQFRVFNGGGLRELSMLNLGGNLMFGFGYQFRKFCVRLEAKQIFEKKQYTAFQFAAQLEL